MIEESVLTVTDSVPVPGVPVPSTCTSPIMMSGLGELSRLTEFTTTLAARMSPCSSSTYWPSAGVMPVVPIRIGWSLTAFKVSRLVTPHSPSEAPSATLISPDVTSIVGAEAVPSKSASAPASTLISSPTLASPKMTFRSNSTESLPSTVMSVPMVGTVMLLPEKRLRSVALIEPRPQSQSLPALI